MGQAYDLYREAVSLTLIALGEQKDTSSIDDETYQFFMKQATPIGGRFESEKTTPIPDVGMVFSDSKMSPSATSKTGSSTCLGIKAPSACKPPVTHQKIPEGVPQLAAASDNSAEEVDAMQTPDDTLLSHDVTVRRREKLLPHAFAGTPMDVSATRQALARSVPLSEKPLYHEVETKKQWSLFSSVTSQEAEQFFTSVSRAIEDRFHATVARFATSSPTFSIDIQLCAADSRIVLIFVEQHLETGLVKQLESIRSFEKKPSNQEPPFIQVGEIHSFPIHLFIVQPDIATDVASKQQLWSRLKSLA